MTGYTHIFNNDVIENILKDCEKYELIGDYYISRYLTFMLGLDLDHDVICKVIIYLFGELKNDNQIVLDYYIDVNLNQEHFEYSIGSFKQYCCFENNNRDCINCFDCKDCLCCKECRGCFGCEKCEDCFDCKKCEDCFACEKCEDCFCCNECRGCIDCKKCAFCKKCIGCVYCFDCKKCEDCFACEKKTYRKNIKNECKE